ncbi:hypothetical protein VOLCADRAFT_88685 [Volvox carteri f. nagariensis]|uniref:Uncharacterized protein n=1 Tax=Volvox carteri f. nagariensis TaxID=3068 RepID=D8TPP0_VOLCA|nr:uncharacterized protein VOLCADRAFT_88685 [Volvox carteri f. nagariensis]EFJ50650.1 hypothetical protein VOLCADRAFT_88685 [Volvox carteri f. nagariensis]|eukprot:XP_002948243.1 hypothetical protein VOLCADRAFT_88685 [Volvox carteri f. nagariensis]
MTTKGRAKKAKPRAKPSTVLAAFGYSRRLGFEEWVVSRMLGVLGVLGGYQMACVGKHPPLTLRNTTGSLSSQQFLESHESVHLNRENERGQEEAQEGTQTQGDLSNVPNIRSRRPRLLNTNLHAFVHRQKDRKESQAATFLSAVSCNW